MLVTALSPVIGYDKASKIAHRAMDEDTTLKQAALASGWIDEKAFDQIVDAKKMVSSYWNTEADLNLEEQSDLILAFARVLYINGQSTDETLSAAERLGGIFGLRSVMLPRWGELQLQAEDRHTRLCCLVAADPSGVNMDRVAATMRAMEDLHAGRLGPGQAMEAIRSISEAAPAPAWLFTIAAAVGAVALAVLFGVRHFPAGALIFASVATGAMVRRSLAHYSSNIFLQPFCAALLAGIIGALAVRYQLSSALRLVAVCPCMVLVPGPAVLNGALDLIQSRIHLGAARLIHACP